MDLYSRLYPNLQFNRSRSSSSIRTVQIHNQPEQISVVNSVEPKSESKPIVVEEEKPKAQTVEQPAEQPVPVDNVKPTEPIEESKPVKRKGKPVPKEAVRATVLPQKGERGLQKKYTDEQRRELYLSQLSKKSVKNAEKEVQEVQQVLESIGRSRDSLDNEEKTLKNRIKLINRAKYFAE